MKSLVTDILYPNKYSTWRNTEINFFLKNYESDILVFKVDSFADIDFDIDFDFCDKNSGFELCKRNILIFNENHNHLNKFNSRIDGTKFNGRFYGSYLITTCVEFNLKNYDFIYHIFYTSYAQFNKFYNFNLDKQFIHLYPGGGWDSRIPSQLGDKVNIITTHPESTKIISSTKVNPYIELKTVPLFNENQILIEKVKNSETINICFSSLGYGTEKGEKEFLEISETYNKKYEEDKVAFFSIGNCQKSEFINQIEKMDYISLQKFYQEKIDIYINLDTGSSFNGWPLGLEAVMSGCVLLTTDKFSVHEKYLLSKESFFIGDTIEDFVEIIKKLHDDRDLLLEKSKHGQKFCIEHCSYENQQLKVKKFIDSIIK